MIPKNLQNFVKISRSVFEIWGLKFWVFGPFLTSTPSCTFWPRIFMAVFRAPKTLPNTVGIVSKSISGFELRLFEYCENCPFGGEYLDNP